MPVRSISYLVRVQIQSKTIWKTDQTKKCEWDRKIVTTAKLASEATILKYEKCSKNLNL